MSRFIRTCATGMTLLAAFLMLEGCRNKKTATTAPSRVEIRNEEAVRMTQEMFQQTDPKARVGLVMAVLAESRLAAVGQVDVKEFHEGDAMTFIDGQRNVIDNGRVVNIADNFVHVKYEPPAPGHRAPREGDMAVRFGH